MPFYIYDWRNQWKVEVFLSEPGKHINESIEKIKIFPVQSLLFKFSSMVTRRL